MTDSELNRLISENRRYLKLIDRNIAAIIVVAAIWAVFTCLNIYRTLAK